MKATLKFDSGFKLMRKEVKAFPVTVNCDSDASARLAFSNIPGAICLYCEGNDSLGKHFTKSAEFKSGVDKRLWCIVSVPEDAEAKEYLGEAILTSDGGEALAREKISITVIKKKADDLQFEDTSKLNRLAWLNSTYAINDTVPKPYIKLKAKGNEVRMLGRRISYSPFGFPLQISTYFTENIQLSDKPLELLSAPFEFNVEGERFSEKHLTVCPANDGADIVSLAESCNFELKVDTRVEFDGYSLTKIRLTAKNDITVSDIFLKMSLKEEITKYFMGLGKEGGYFDRDIDFKWSSARHQDNFWVGAVNGGIRVKFTGENYVKPLVNIYYSQKPMAVPESWGNEGRGGIKFDSKTNTFTAYSGERTMKAGETVCYNFDLIVTPLKPIDLEKSLNTRIFHRPPEAKIDIENRRDARIVNIHHGNDLNPYINYPFFENDALRKFINEAHRDGLLVKVYYTIRELTIKTPEFSALRDFDYEIFEPSYDLDANLLWQGEAKQWIKENVGDDVIPAWRQDLFGDKYKGQFDASIITNGQSRLANFYIEGLRYLVEHMEIDGLYIDDLAYDRNTMKRVRRTVDKRPEAYIDFHTWNHYTERAAFSNSINLYMELLPYIDKAWIGEGFDYDMPEDHWLVAISGIPFGLMSEMMCEGQPWRGLTFGMTTRLGWVPEADPTNIWELIDKYELGKCELLGFWDSRNTVKVSNPAVVPTVYKGKSKTYIHLANFTNTEQSFDVAIDGISDISLSAPEIRDFQDAAEYGAHITLPAGRAIFAELK